MTDVYLAELSRIKPWRSFSEIIWQWSIIIGSSSLAVSIDRPLCYIIAGIFIATRQHSLLILAHEAVHFRLSKSRALNNFLGNVFCAWPNLITVEGYRKVHFKHHEYTNTPIDPDLCRVKDQWSYKFPKTKWQFWRHIASYLCGVYILRDIYQVTLVYGYGYGDKWSWGRIFIVLGAPAALVLNGYGLVFLYLWVIPSLTVLPTILYFRYVAEHFHHEYITRNVIPNWWQKILIAPLNVGYHLNHHNWPSIPFYNLKNIHANPLLIRYAHGYGEVFREITK